METDIFFLLVNKKKTHKLCVVFYLFSGYADSRRKIKIRGVCLSEIMNNEKLIMNNGWARVARELFTHTPPRFTRHPFPSERGVYTEFIKIYIPRIFILPKHAPN
jgi:hypothetical protein